MTEENVATNTESSTVQEAPSSIGGFAKTFLIIDLVFLAIVLLGVAAIVFIPAEIYEAAGSPKQDTLFPMLTGLALFLVGCTGNIALLNKKAWGAMFCYASLLFVAIGIFISFSDLEQTQAMAAGVPGAESAMMATAIIAIVLRVAYNIAYVFAVRSGAKNIRLMELAQ